MTQVSMTEKRPIAFISGALGGVGAAAAAYFHGQGYRLWLTARNYEKLAEFSSDFSDPILTVSDLENPEELEALCLEIENSAEPPRVALVNAGVVVPGSIVSMSRRQLDQQLNVNLRAAMHVSHAMAKRMLREASGHIVNVISAAAFISLKESVAYSATKFGQRGFVIGLAEELHGTGVHVTGLYPGAIDTPMLETEARNGGSALNFMSDPITTADVIEVLDQALREKKEHYIIPKRDALTCKIINAFPGLMRKKYPEWEREGEKGRKRYLDRINSSAV
jgi:short-subunit dehydrogenase